MSSNPTEAEQAMRLRRSGERYKTVYRYGLSFMCMGVLLNWLGFYESALHPIRYLGLAFVATGILLICTTVCRTMSREASQRGQNADDGDITTVERGHQSAPNSKPPDYNTVIRMDANAPPPSYEEAIKLKPLHLLKERAPSERRISEIVEHHIDSSESSRECTPPQRDEASAEETAKPCSSDCLSSNSESVPETVMVREVLPPPSPVPMPKENSEILM